MIRECLDCDCDISELRSNQKRCPDCQKLYKKKYMADWHLRNNRYQNDPEYRKKHLAGKKERRLRRREAAGPRLCEGEDCDVNIDHRPPNAKLCTNCVRERKNKRRREARRKKKEAA